MMCLDLKGRFPRFVLDKVIIRSYGKSLSTAIAAPPAKQLPSNAILMCPVV